MMSNDLFDFLNLSKSILIANVCVHAYTYSCTHRTEVEAALCIASSSVLQVQPLSLNLPKASLSNNPS